MAAKRNYRVEYQRRNVFARELGFTGYTQQRRAPRRLVRAEDFKRLPDSARESRSLALRVLGYARGEGTTVETAASRLGVPMRSIRYWAGDALEETRSGRTLPRVGDRLTRLRPIFLEGESELVFVPVRGSRAVDRAHDAFSLQYRYITGDADASELERLRGVRIAGRPVEADPAQLRRIAALGIDVPEAYRETVG